MIKAFFAYSSVSREVIDIISRAADAPAVLASHVSIETWQKNEIEGQLLIAPILKKINNSDFLVADLSHQNKNVYFEIGYAIAKKKGLFFTRSATHSTEPEMLKSVGLFDVTGYRSYNNSQRLIDALKEIATREPKPYSPTVSDKNLSQPCYIVLPQIQAEPELHICTRLKNTAKIHYRVFDPNEYSRLSIQEAIDEVASSFGVVLPFTNRPGLSNAVHNLRCAFIAGLCEGYGVQYLITNEGENNLDLDYRHRGFSFRAPEQLNKSLTDFGLSITESMQLKSNNGLAPANGSLAKLSLGASSAENEEVELANYYLRTEIFERILRNEVNVIAGRKGTGKTALFIQAGLRLARDRWNIVVSLQPEGYQLKKLKEVVLDKLEAGSRDHLLAAFWEYVFLIEIAAVICSNESGRYENDRNLKKLYDNLLSICSEAHCESGDFAERMLQLINRIVERTHSLEGVALTRSDIINIIYKNDITQLKEHIIKYVSDGKKIWLIVDNLDKGWYAHGVDEVDIAMLRSLLDAAQRVRRDLKSHCEMGTIVFVRNDVFELAEISMSDKGKLVKDIIDWSDNELLRTLIKNRIGYSLNRESDSFQHLWNDICVSHLRDMDGMESSDYFIERSLKRPRALIDFIQKAKAHAVNLGKDKIDDDDIKYGEKRYSLQLVEDLNDEMADVYGIARNVLFAFIGVDAMLSFDECKKLLQGAGFVDSGKINYVDILAWYGFVGIYVGDKVNYIYDLSYSMRKFRALMSKDDVLFQVNPAFYSALEIKN